MKKISIVGGCYNEEKNIEELYIRCLAVLKKFPQYDYEFVLSDNCSTDGTQNVILKIAEKDPKFKAIFNANNFGFIRSPHNALLNASGDAVVWMCTDLQEPPEMIETFIRKWEEGYRVVCGVRSGTHANILLEGLRAVYYLLLEKTANVKIIKKFTGFGLYDRCFIDALKKYHDPYPFFRSLVSEIGFKRCEVPFIQDCRKHGKTKFHLYSLYDLAMQGFINNSTIPLRMSIILGLLAGFFSFFMAIIFIILKIIFREAFPVGYASIIVCICFFSSMQLIFIGVLGEYLSAVWIQVKNKPLVIEERRVNFDKTN